MTSGCIPENPVARIRHNLVGLRMPRALEALEAVIQQIERGQLGAIEAIDILPAIARPQPYHGPGQPRFPRQARGDPFHRPVRHRQDACIHSGPDLRPRGKTVGKLCCWPDEVIAAQVRHRRAGAGPSLVSRLGNGAAGVIQQ